jgi:predicted molibdopterin-dependent oxidoreductase YjgC
VTGQSHVVMPGTSYLERDGTTVNLEGRPQRQRRAVAPPSDHDELELFARVAQRFGLNVSPWPSVSVEEHASLPARTDAVPLSAPAATAPAAPNGGGLRLLPYRPLFAGPAVERIPELAFQRPLAEIELSVGDARSRGVWTGDAVAVGSNGASRTLEVKVNRRLMDGVARVAAEHAAGLGETVEVTRQP